MTTTRLDHITAIARAQADRPASDLGGTKRAALRVALHTYAGGKCFTCGQATRLDAGPREGDRAEIGHVIGHGDSKRGMVPGSVGNQCRACNSDLRHVADLTPHMDESDAALIPLAWPTWADMLNSVEDSDTAHADRARAIRTAKGFPA